MSQIMDIYLSINYITTVNNKKKTPTKPNCFTNIILKDNVTSKKLQYELKILGGFNTASFFHFFIFFECEDEKVLKERIANRRRNPLMAAMNSYVSP